MEKVNTESFQLRHREAMAWRERGHEMIAVEYLHEVHKRGSKAGVRSELLKPIIAGSRSARVR